MSESHPPVVSLAYEPATPATRRRVFAGRAVAIAGVIGLACAVVVVAATIVDPQDARRWLQWEVMLSGCLIAAKALSVSALVAGIALVRRAVGEEEHRDPLIGAWAGGGGVVILIAWALVIASRL